VEFSVLEVLLHQEALLSTMEMLMNIQKAVEKVKPPPTEVQLVTLQRRSSIVSSTVSSTVKKMAPRKGLVFGLALSELKYKALVRAMSWHGI